MTYFAFRRRGFLTRLPRVPSVVRKRYRAIFRLCERINRVSHRMLLDATVVAGKPLRLLGALSFLRTIQALQAGYILARAGLGQDCAVCLRTSFEALCVLRACQVKPELAVAYMTSDEHEQLKLANANITRLAAEESPDPDLLRHLQQAKVELEASIAASKSKKVSIYEIANAVDFGAVYDTMWRIVSKYAHISPRALEEFIAHGGDHITYGRDYREIQTHVTTIAEFSLLAQAELGRLFDMDAPDDHERLGGEFKALVAQLQ